MQNKTHEIVDERAARIREEEINQALREQLGRNAENSSTPSSQVPFRAKVQNNRKPTGKKQGAQPGHKGHRRHAPNHVDKSVFVDAPEWKDNPDYYRTGKQIHKKLVDIRMDVVVTDYYADVYRRRSNGSKCHAPFPEGLELDITYGNNIRATVFLMKNHLNVPEDKICEYFREMTQGQIQISRGMVNSINREFNLKTSEEQAAIFAELANSEILHVDMTTVRMNGKLTNVVLCSDKQSCMYSYREHKGDEGIKGTPAEVNPNTLIHDHDKTMYHYGGRHQECNAHHQRYLKSDAE